MKKHVLLALALGFLLQGAPANAALVTAELRVNGLSCPFCAFGIEKKLLDVEGVKDVEVFLDEGRLALTFETDNEATVSDLQTAVEKAGFELAGLELKARGKVIDGANGGALLVANSRLSFDLAERNGESPQSVSARTLAHLRTMSGEGGSVVVSGSVEALGESQPTLVLKPAEAETR